MNGFNITTHGLRKVFGGFVAVDDLTLSIRQGEIFGLLGPNGAGKTTSIRMITGLLKPDQGMVSFHGLPVTRGPHRHDVGICPQELVLWNNLTCLEQLIYMGSMYKIPASVSRKRAEVLLERLGLQEKGKSLVRTLSGGMKRRMNILMALIHDPAILILDEPEAGLDPQSRILVRDFIRSLAREKTVIFTTHNMDEADRICDRIAIMDRGKMLVTDTPASLKSGLGSGDRLEITLCGRPPETVTWNETDLDVVISDSVMTIRSRDILNKLPMILDRISREGCKVTGMNLAENTLEDVFIALTGRRLRE
jgi:ABC-2 type transport system ATP-binding protein